MPGKESKMSFILSAKADGSFSSTFSRAQQELSKMQQEIQRLNSAQGDISSYQKQQQAIEATTRKLERLKEQQRLLNKQKEEMRAAGQSTTALEREEKKLEQTVDNTNGKLQQQQQKLTQTGERLRQAGVDTSNLTSESKRLEQEMIQLKNEQEKVAEGAQKSGQAMAEAFDAAASAMAAAGIIQGLRQIYDAFAECVGVAAEFESTMSTVEALSGANGEEMAALSAQAKELGATTVFSAQEAGDAMTYMGMAGWKAQDMISGMDGVLNLAAASGEDLAMVSDIVTDNLTAFGLKASDTARFADVLAAAATNSNTSVSIMGETFKQSAAIAGALGYSVEDVAVAVGLMANAGIKGSIAGTVLKNTFNGLLEGATLSGEALGEYEFTALQADGTMKGFKETLDELRGAFSQMSDAEKVQNAMLIAGKRGYNGLLAILNATEEDYNKLTSAINDSAGAAERMAQIKLDNLKGDLALANSEAEAFKDSVGSALIPVLRNLVQAGTEAISWAASFTEEHQSAVAAVAGLAAGIAAAVVAVTALSAAIKIFQALNLAAMFTSPIGQIMMLAGAVAGLVLAVNAADAAAKSNRDEVYQLTAASQKQYREVQQATAAYNKAMEGKFQDTAATIALRAHMDELTEAYEANKQTLADWQAENQSVLDSVQELRDGFQESSNSFADQSAEAQALAYRLDQLAGKSHLTAAEQQQMLGLVERLNTSVPGLNLSYDQQTGKLNKNTEAIKKMAQAQAKQRYEEEKQEYYTDLYTQQLRLEEQRTEAKENLAAAQERLNSLESSQGPGSSMMDRQAYQDAVEGVRLYTEEYEALDSELASVTAELSGYEAEIAGAGDAAGSAEAATQNLESALSTLSTAYTEAYASARESLSGQFSLWEEAAEVSATSLSTLQENIQSQIDYWNNYDTNLETVKQAAQNAGVDLSSIWGHLTDGSADAVNAVAGIADAINSSADGGAEALQGYVDKYQELQDAQAQAADTIASGADAVQTAMDGVRAAMETGASDLNFADQFTASAQESINAFTTTLGSADVSAAMAGLQGQVAAGVASLDVSGEAAAAGTAMGTQIAGGLAQGIAQGGAEASAAMAQAGAQVVAQGQEATAAMQETMTTGATTAMQSAAEATTTGGQAVATAAGAAATNAGTNFSNSMSPSVFAGAASSAMQAAVNAVNAKKGALVAAARAAGQAAAAAFKEAQGSVGGLATGTRSAPPGLTWVGEKGPELVYFHGGETIIPGSATVSALHGAAMLVGTHGPELMYMQGGETVLTATETASVLRGREHEIQAYAEGTRNAQKGLALVGENGAEIGTILPQAMGMMAAYRNNAARTSPDRFQAERVSRVLDAVRNYEPGGAPPEGPPVQIVFNIYGDPSPETVDRFRAFIYSAEFEERAVEAVNRARKDAARRAYR